MPTCLHSGAHGQLPLSESPLTPAPLVQLGLGGELGLGLAPVARLVPRGGGGGGRSACLPLHLLPLEPADERDKR